MPSLTMIKPLGWAVFMSKMLKLPSKADFKDPQDKPQYIKGTQNDWGFTPTFMPFFTPQHPGLKHHQDSCDTIGKEFKDLHDKCCDAISFAVDMWRLQAKFKDLKVMAVCAIGSPGCLDGPKLESNIKNAPSVAALSGNYAKYRDAVAKGVSKCFADWQGQVMVPGLPWYPAFAAFPGPQGPPMPNVPMPLITCVSSKMTSIIMPNDMKAAMIDALPQSMKKEDKDKQHEALFESIATVASLAFTIWLAAQQVMLVMGKGPIPTFAPPYVPVGPVLGGGNIAAPGHLIA